MSAYGMAKWPLMSIGKFCVACASIYDGVAPRYYQTFYSLYQEDAPCDIRLLNYLEQSQDQENQNISIALVESLMICKLLWYISGFITIASDNHIAIFGMLL